VTPSARLAAAIDLLAAIEAAPRKPADAVANDFLRARRYIGSGDRRAVSDRAWRVLRTRRKLDWWLLRAALPPGPRLLVAASLMLEGWSADGLATAYSGGQYAPTKLSGAERAGLATLAGHTLTHPDMPEAVRLDIPDWLLPELAGRFGAGLAAELGAMDQPAPLDLRVNVLKATREQAQAALAGEGIAAEPTPLSPWGLRVAGRLPVTSGAAFRDGLVEIQDEGSQLVVALCAAEPGMRVADYCAGAGGKTLALAMTMRNRGQIVACDVSAKRLEGAVRRLRRADIHNAERHLLEPGDKWAKRRAGSFDVVLVDAPCTGTGTWRRNPDARLRLAEQDLAELCYKQRRIADQAARLVRAGGRLVYATCSMLPRENEALVEAFLADHPDFELVPLARAWPFAAPPNAGPFLSLSPLRNGTDGFFAAVLRRAPGGAA
jgi:16S rRNA (cytosine967-C5)-methyltransferase